MKRTHVFTARLKPVALALVCMGLAPVMAQILPSGASVAGGSVAIGAPTALATGGLALTINQASNRGIVNWSTFSIGALDRVNVVQQAASAVLLNRVTGKQASLVAGGLSTSLAGNPAAVGGSVYLINPNGITFANGATVNVGGLVASTMDVAGPDQTTRNAAFMATGQVAPGARAALSFAGNSGAGVRVQPGANITAGTGGVALLSAASVSNAGTVTADRGAINLAAAEGVTLVVDPVGDGLTTLRIDNPATVATLVENAASGTLRADGGLVALKTASSASDAVVRQAGVVRARTLENRGGQIVLEGRRDEDDIYNSSGPTVSLEGGRIDATGGTAAGGRVSVEGAYVRMGGGSTIDASGSTGGSVSLYAQNGLAMSEDAAIAASGTAGAGGTIAVGASTELVNGLARAQSPFTTGASAHVSGALTARGTTDGGNIATGAAVLEVSRTAVIDAAGGTGANGSWTVNTPRNLSVVGGDSGSDPVYRPDAFPSTSGSSAVADAAVGGALGRATDVVLNSGATGSRDSNPSQGVVFANDAQVVKTQGRESTLTVNSDRGIAMFFGSNIESRGSAGALNLNFNADASGAVQTAASAPMTRSDDTGQGGGFVEIYGASITTQGGNVRFYGQGDAVAGRATGTYNDNDGGNYQGITVQESRIATGAGSILMRGQGLTQTDSDGTINGGAGILVAGSSLSTGAGTITLNGVGGLAADGVTVRSMSTEGDPILSSVVSATGNIGITGRSRDWVAGETAGPNFSGGSAGVSLVASLVQTGGDITVRGTGGSMAAAAADPDFVDAIANNNGTTAFAASSGVETSGAHLDSGGTLSITGSAGSRGFTVQPNPDSTGGTVQQDATDASAVAVLAATGNGLLGRQVRIDGGTGDVRLRQVADDFFDSRFTNADAGSEQPLVGTRGLGGSIAIAGRNVLVQGGGTVARLDADMAGPGNGGAVSVTARAVEGDAASGIVALDSDTRVSANATTQGQGGSITVKADSSLFAYGAFEARGAGEGAQAGGTVSTSGANFDLRGARVDAAGSRGTAGQWIIDPYDVSITAGNTSGSLGSNPFVPLTSSVIQDGDINAALNGGTSVSIGTGSGGSATAGNITLGRGVNINATTAASGGTTLTLNAYRDVRTADPGVIIQSGAVGGLNVVMRSNNTQSSATGGGQIRYGGTLLTNGGNVDLTGIFIAPTGNDSAIRLSGVIDTRQGQADGAGASGGVRLNGFSQSAGNIASSQPGVWLDGATLRTGSGTVNIQGGSSSNTGVRISGTGTQGIFTSSGQILVTGLGTDRPGVGSQPAQASAGVLVDGATVTSDSGMLVLHGNVADLSRASSTSAGVQVANGANLSTTGGGQIEIAGTAAAGGRGVWVSATAPTGTQTRVSGTGVVSIRSLNDGTADSITIAAPVSSADAIALRPGGVNTSGVSSDSTATPILLGTGAARGFALSDADFAQLNPARNSTGTIVVGSTVHAADITVTGALATASNLTLHNGGGGTITLNATVNAPTLGLVSAGDITQAADAAISAGTLHAASTNGNVRLQSALNRVDSVGGSAAGGFSFTDADGVAVSATSVRTYDPSSIVLPTLAASSLGADTVQLTTLGDDLVLATSVLGGRSVRFDSYRSIRAGDPNLAVAARGTGPVDITFNADAANNGPSVGGGQVSYDGAVLSNGGNVTLNGNWSATGAGDTAIHLTGVLDSRQGQADGAALNGNVTLTGSTTTPVANSSSNQPAVWLDGAAIRSGSGAVTIIGRSSNNTGVRVSGNTNTPGIFSTTGAISLTGFGTDRPAGGSLPPQASAGVAVDNASIRSGSGLVTLRGAVTDTARAASQSAGVVLGSGAVVATTGGGGIELTGSAAATGRGLWAQAGSGVSGSADVVLRAGNNDTADAITIAGPVTATGVLDLRPGAVAASGAGNDRGGTAITLGTGATTGFAVSQADMSQLSAGTIVVGSNIHGGNITVAGDLSTGSALTLQNQSDGAIRLNGAVSASRLALLAAGDITQTDAGAITSGALLARSNAGRVDLQNPRNSVGSVGGGTPGDFAYVNADAVNVAAVQAGGFDAIANQAQALAGGPLSAGSVLVRTVTQDLTLATGVVASGAANLVAGGRFQNPGAQTVAAAQWRIGADTWLGEQRGGLTGSGSLPNLYGCGFSGLCSVTVPAADNHFIYVQRPTATVTVADASRQAGEPDPPFTYRVTGTILNDSASAFSGTLTSNANAGSPAGSYTIGGTVTSAAGYRVDLVPGRLVVNALAVPPVVPPPVVPPPDVLPPAVPPATVAAPPASFLAFVPLATAMADTSDIHTYTFDRNVGLPPICAATGPLDGDRVAQGNDVLAREWSRVRSRPNLSSCVSTERRNGCGDF